MTTALAAESCRMTGLSYYFGVEQDGLAFSRRLLGAGSLFQLDDCGPGIRDVQYRTIANLARVQSFVLLLEASLSSGDELVPVMKNLSLQRRDTVSLVLHGCEEDDWEACSRAINCVEPEQCMIFAHETPKLPIAFLEKYPIVMVEKPTDQMMDVIHRAPEYSYLPPLPRMENYLGYVESSLHPDHKLQIQSVMNYVYAGAHQIDEHVLKAISEEIC